jgi:hypothetical protein
MRTRLPGGSFLEGLAATRQQLGRGPVPARWRPRLELEVTGSVEVGVRPILRPSPRAERQESALVSYGDPIPTDPEAILAHWLTLAELRAEARAREPAPRELRCGRP